MDLHDIEKILKNHENRISELETTLKTKPIVETNPNKSVPSKILGLIIPKLNQLNLSELTLIVLKFHDKLTREEIIKILKKWRKKGADSLRGGNFSRDLIRTGFIRDMGKIGKETVYELTEDGEIKADDIIKELGKNPVNKTVDNIG